MMTVEQAQKETAMNMEEEVGNHNGIIFSSCHAVNEQLMFTYDDSDESVNIFVYLRPFKSFFKRLYIGLGYIFNLWYFTSGNWEMFMFDKDESERLIAFLKKVK